MSDLIRTDGLVSFTVKALNIIEADSKVTRFIDLLQRASYDMHKLIFHVAMNIYHVSRTPPPALSAYHLSRPHHYCVKSTKIATRSDVRRELKK